MDDAPGAAAIGIVLLVVSVVLGVRAARNRLSLARRIGDAFAPQAR